MFIEIEQIGHLGTAPSVNALVIVADDAKILVCLGQTVHELELRMVGVLILVHHDIVVTLAAFVQRLGAFCKQSQHEQDQVIEIDGVAGLECLLIGRNQALGQGGQVLILGNELIAIGVSPATDQRQDGTGIWFLRSKRNLAQDAANHAQLLSGIVNDKIFLVAKLRDMPTQDADAQRVECADRRLLRLAVPIRQAPLGYQPFYTFLHLAGGFVCESDGKNVTGPDAARDHVSHAAGDDARLAGAGTGEDEQRAVNGAHSLPLLGVQRGKLHPAAWL